MNNADLIEIIEKAAEKRGVTPSYLCRLALNDGKVIAQLRNGGSITLRRLNSLNQYLADHDLLPPAREEGKSGEATDAH